MKTIKYEIYKKAEKRLDNAYKSVENILDNDLNTAIGCLIVEAVDMNVSLEELLSGTVSTSSIGLIIDLIFKHCSNNCKSGLICEDTLRQIETEYITATYNYSVAYRNYLEVK